MLKKSKFIFEKSKKIIKNEKILKAIRTKKDLPSGLQSLFLVFEKNICPIPLKLTTDTFDRLINDQKKFQKKSIPLR